MSRRGSEGRFARDYELCSCYYKAKPEHVELIQCFKATCPRMNPEAPFAERELGCRRRTTNGAPLDWRHYQFDFEMGESDRSDSSVEHSLQLPTLRERDRRASLPVHRSIPFSQRAPSLEKTDSSETGSSSPVMGDGISPVPMVDDDPDVGVGEETPLGVQGEQPDLAGHEGIGNGEAEPVRRESPTQVDERLEVPVAGVGLQFGAPAENVQADLEREIGKGVEGSHVG